jgi:quercetin dioxygenase-like cupin family protein
VRGAKIAGGFMVLVLNKHDLPGSETSLRFVGYLHNDVNVSFFISETPTGKGPSLHKHSYAEIFVIFDGQLTFTVGDVTIEASGGQVVIVPPETPHKFINLSPEIARHIDIHTSAQMITTWLEQ